MNSINKSIKFPKRYFIISLILMIMTANLSGCAFNNKEPIAIQKSGMFFDTFITIGIYGNDDERLLDKCFELCTLYENTLSATVIGSDVYNINNSKGNVVAVSEDTFNLIKSSKYYYDISNGQFDISIYPVYKLWDFTGGSNSLPDNLLLADALSHVNYNNIELIGENSVKLKDPFLEIELGAIAKGYIADRLADYLKSEGITSAVINIGGDMNVIGQKTIDKPFIIGIKDPNDASNVLCTLKLNNKCVATSGTYERAFTINNTNYHHILSPDSGYPVNTDIKSVTVITDSSEKADALCTCLILFGSLKAIDFIEKTNNAEAIIVLNDGTIINSSGANKYLITSQ